MPRPLKPPTSTKRPITGALGRMLARQHHRLREVGLFIAVGVAAVAVYVGGVSFGVRVLGWPVWLSNALAYALSTAVAYMGNYHFTFGSDVSHARALPRYLAVSALGLVASTAIVSLLSRTGLAPELASLLLSALWPLASFALQRALVYR